MSRGSGSGVKIPVQSWPSLVSRETLPTHPCSPHPPDPCTQKGMAGESGRMSLPADDEGDTTAGSQAANPTVGLDTGGSRRPMEAWEGATQAEAPILYLASGAAPIQAL